MVDFPANHDPATFLDLSIEEIERNPSRLRSLAVAGEPLRLMDGDRQIAVVVPTAAPDEEVALESFSPRQPGQTWLQWMLANPCPVDFEIERERDSARGTEADLFS